MKPHERPANVLITVGTNPLPVLVASWRLVKHLKPQKLWFLHSNQSEAMALAVAEQLRKRWTNEATAAIPIKTVPITDAASPEVVANVVGRLAKDGSTGWHLHYTGGTKTMALKAMQALMASQVFPTDSYLDINRHTVLNERGCLVDPTVKDERTEWNLDLRDLCALHGLTVDFRLAHRYKPKEKEDVWTTATACFGKAKPEDGDFRYPSNGEPLTLEWEAIGADIFRLLLESRALVPEVDKFRREFNRNWSNEDVRWPKLPCQGPDKPILWPKVAGLDTGIEQEWAAIPGRINKEVTEIRWDAVRGLEKVVPGPSFHLERMIHLVNGGDLEMAVHRSLREALAKRGMKSRLRHSTYFAMKPQPGQEVARRCFELDVVAILGYQLVVISCARETGESRRPLIKNKAFEVLHRARQVGGDGARALVICGLDADAASELEEELHDEIGLHDDSESSERMGVEAAFSSQPKGTRSLPPLRIWPKETWKDLAGYFDNYLDSDLKWRT